MNAPMRACLLLAVSGSVHASVPSVQRVAAIPLSFEAAASTEHDDVKFVARGSGYSMFFRPAEAVFEIGGSSLRMRLEGADPHGQVEGLQPLEARSNYFLGRNPALWRTDVPHFGRVRYRNAYPGIDVIFYGTGRSIEYDIVVSPGSDPGRIQLRFEGAGALRVSRNGDLVLAAGGELRQRKPLVYQETAGVRRRIEGRYVIAGNQVRFAIGKYDKRLPLVIDPVLSYSTYLGGSGEDVAYDVFVDASGIFIVGQTASSNFPVATPFQAASRGTDAFITKLNLSGDALIYSTYLGGGGTDSARGLAVDAAGTVFVTGETKSADFPLVRPFQSSSRDRDAFVVRLNNTGSALLSSTYLGGSSADAGRAIAVDAGGIYVTGGTESSDFPTRNAIQAAKGGGSTDVFVTKLALDGNALVYSTYLGGAGGDEGLDINVDSSGNAYVSGLTGSNAFPVMNPLQRTRAGLFDGFVSKLDASGAALVFSTYLGGTDQDEVEQVALGADGSLYLCGATRSTNFPTANPALAAHGGGDDVFAARLNPAGTQLLFSTFAGGSAAEFCEGLALDAAGGFWITGFTDSDNFPVLNSFQTRRGRDAFIARYSAAGIPQFSTLFGGNGIEAGLGVAVDASGRAYVVGGTTSDDMPAVAPFQARFGGAGGDAFLIRISEPDAPSAGTIAFVSAASFSSGVVAPESIVSGYGQGLAPDIAAATSTDLPVTLAGVRVLVRDSAGAERAAPLFFVSPGQVNFSVPAGMALGLAEVTVTRNEAVVARGQLNIARVAPGLFAANANGQGVAAALWVRVAADGTQTDGLVFQCGPAPGSCLPISIDLGVESDQVFLLLFGTGFRGQSQVSATVGGESAEVLGAVAQGQYPGLDQANLRLHRGLAGRGDVDVRLMVDGRAANVVTVRIGGAVAPTAPRITSISPAFAAAGSTANIMIAGQDLGAVSAIEFTPADGLTVGNIQAAATSVTAQVTIAAGAPLGMRSVAVAAPSGRSNALSFEIRQAAPPPPTSVYLPLQSGVTVEYRVTIPENVSLPYQPVIEAPQGLLCSNIFCGLGNWSAGQFDIRVSEGDPIPGTSSLRATLSDAARRFLFWDFVSASAQFELRVRDVGQGFLQMELVATFSSFRLYRPLARLNPAAPGTPQTVTVPAGAFSAAVLNTLTLVGNGIDLSGTWTTDVYLAPGVGIVKAVMRDSAGRVLFTLELLRLS